MAVMEQIAACRVIPVVVLDDASRAVSVARALQAGGIDVMEITLRTGAALGGIDSAAGGIPGMTVGAGTVLSAGQAEEAINAGAKFIVSPGSDAEIIRLCVDRGVPVLPGVLTPSEIMAGLKLGVTVFKFFPAESYGGLAAINALSGPFPQVRFIPTGGIFEKNAAVYLANKNVLAVGGSWMATVDMIREGRYAEITRKAAEAAALCRT